MNGSVATSPSIPGRYVLSVGVPDGKAPMGWEWIALNELAEMGTGHTPSRRHSEYWGGDIPWIGIGDAAVHHGGVIFDTEQHTNELGLLNSSARLVPKGTVCLSRTASIGYVIVVGKPMATSQDFVTWTCERGLDPNFLKLALMAEGTHIRRFGRGTTHTTIYFRELRALHICIPPVNEQKRIVDKLERCFESIGKAITALDSVPALLTRHSESVLGAAFRGEATAGWRNSCTEIEPAHALIARTSRPSQPKGGRPPTERRVFGQFALSVNKTSQVAPPGWEWVPLLRVARQETGHTPSRKHPEYWDGGIPWIGISDARRHHGKEIFDTLETISADGLANSACRLLPAGTVCLSRTASVGYSLVLGREMTTSQAFVTWTCTSALLPKYLMYLFMAERTSLLSFARGTTILTIYFPELRAFHICLPPLEEQKALVDTLDGYFTCLECIGLDIETQQHKARELVRSIFEKAFTGGFLLQDASDEPVTVLLKRESADTNQRRKRKERQKRSQAGRMKRKRQNIGTISVTEALKRVKGTVATGQLLLEAGYPVDVSSEQLEYFFLDVRESLKRRLIACERQGSEDFFTLIGFEKKDED